MAYAVPDFSVVTSTQFVGSLNLLDNGVAMDTLLAATSGSSRAPRNLLTPLEVSWPEP